MTAHKSHTNILHNQCLSLHALAMFIAINEERRKLDDSWNFQSARAQWIYWHAARHVIPPMFEGVEEEEIPSFHTGHAVHLPKVMAAEALYEAETLPGGFSP